MSSDHKACTAVISVGGFLGMGSKLVSVPFDRLQIGKDKIVMPGATTDIAAKHADVQVQQRVTTTGRAMAR